MQSLRTAATKAGFVAACRLIPMPDVMIDRKAVEAYASFLRKPETSNPRKEYLTPRGNTPADLEMDFVELAANAAVNSGYLYEDADGKVAKWEVGGSGAKALLARMDQARMQRIMPSDVLNPDAMREYAAKTFEGTPFAAQRIKIWEELSDPASIATLIHVVRAAHTNDDYKFLFEHLRLLGQVSPTGFGEDPFLKKAALLPLMFAAVAGHKRGRDCVDLTDSVIPADYRLPQTQHNVGILRFSDRLVATLEEGTLLPEEYHFVTQIRAGTVLASDMIMTARPDIGVHHLDKGFMTVARLADTSPDRLDEKQLADLGLLEDIRQGSGFNVSGFMGQTKKPMNVATMRF